MSGNKTLRFPATRMRRSRRTASLRRLVAEASLSADDLIALRPASGICPTRDAEVIGRRAARDLAAGVLLTLEDLA